ncbi:MAG TPA: DNA internalization-related competence protein ComEC/Rec2, partial [Bacteroidota bacterium]
VGAPPSVVRATLMAVVLLVGPLLERKIDVYQSLSVAALVLLLWDSNNLFNVGFQLSFIAVLAIVYFYPVFSSVIPRLSLRVRRIWLLEPALKVFFVSLAAQLGTLPFTAYYFDRVSIVSFLANIVVVPVAAFNVVLGFTALLVFPVSAWLAQSYAALNGSLVTLLLWFVKAAAGVPYAYLSVGNVEASFPFLYYIGLVGLVNLHSKKTIKFLLVAGLVVLNVLVYSSFMRSEERSLQATFIDVWQGDAILLEFPSGKNVLLDAGSRSEEFDSGERIVAPFLRFKGITKLDALIMSHPHSDHIGGVPYLIDHVALGRLIEPRIEGKSATYQEVHLMAAERSVSVSRYGAGDTLQIDSETRLYVLYPDSLDDRPKNLNNASLVVKLVYGSSELLLVGDVEKDVEEKLISRYARYLSSAVLKVGHHGSSTSSTPEFLEAVQPSVAVISVGRNNKFRHPSPQVVELFRRRGIDLHRTDREGAIVLRSDGKKFNVFDWRQE